MYLVYHVQELRALSANQTTSQQIKQLLHATIVVLVVLSPTPNFDQDLYVFF